MAKSTRTPVPAKVVRAWASENPDLAPLLGSRGRLHPKVVDAFNKGNRKTVYGEGNVALRDLSYSTTDKAGRNRTAKVKATDAEVRAALGHAPGRRGRFGKADLAKAGEVIAKARGLV